MYSNGEKRMYINVYIKKYYKENKGNVIQILKVNHPKLWSSN